MVSVIMHAGAMAYAAFNLQVQFVEWHPISLQYKIFLLSHLLCACICLSTRKLLVAPPE
jgi:hypothetical protein